MPLEVELGEEVTLLDRDAGFEQTGVDDDPFAHGSTSPTRRPRPVADASVASHWNCRIRTERRSPRAIRETSIEEPP